MKKYLSYIIIIIVLVIVLFIFVSPYLNKIDFWSRIGITGTKKQQASVFTELLKQRNISELETASYYTELIFPFDFLAKEYPRTSNEWNQLRIKAEGDWWNRTGTGINAVNYDYLNADEKKNYLFYDTVKVWIDMAGQNRSGSNQYIDIDNTFNYMFRLKVRARAGYDLSGNEWVSVSETGDLVTISLPEPKILHLSTIIDSPEPWPDPFMNPLEEGRLINLLVNNYINDIIWETKLIDGKESGLAILAAENGERLIRRLIPANLQVEFTKKTQ